ncbi:ankyrin repeat-containing domain protein [Lactarius akahatsu]|uniref:Ankyrin repeat-containing domain protein n=1 Tax=Lactarius akahatsu TaxID=416441 RepID=A0AAD4LPS0_9AGAM|nr:ankyrin repeat-containing domain protein [Lactarius akahatsu]
MGKLSVAQMLLEHPADANSRNDDGQAPLHLLSKRETSQDQDNDCDLAKLLLEHGANMNERDKNNVTPLDLATYLKKSEIVRVLLDHSAKANSETAIGETTLHSVSCVKYESQKDGVRAAQPLLERGVDVDTQHKDDRIPLHTASYHGKFRVVRLLLDYGAAANAKTNNGETALHKVSCGKYESQEDGVGIAQLLLERGVDVNAPRADHQTPLHFASYYGNIAIARLLLDRGANPSANAGGDLGSTPLHKVSRGKYKSQDDGIRIAQLLLERGADVNALRTDHQTPLHLASYNGNIAIARLLLDHGAKANVGDDRGDTPLHNISYGEYESQDDGIRVARLLLEHGVDVDAPRPDHRTSLHVASYHGNIAIARLLLDRGANANAGGDRESPLHRVSYGKYKSQDDGVRVAQLLLERGADVDASRSGGGADHQTPLHFASYYGNLAIAQLLLDCGAKSDALDDFGKAPLHEVSRGTYDSEDPGVGVAQLLLEHGADMNAKAKSGQTPIDYATCNQKFKLAQLLLEHAVKFDAQRPQAS